MCLNLRLGSTSSLSRIPHGSSANLQALLLTSALFIHLFTFLFHDRRSPETPKQTKKDRKKQTKKGARNGCTDTLARLWSDAELYFCQTLVKMHTLHGKVCAYRTSGRDGGTIGMSRFSKRSKQPEDFLNQRRGSVRSTASLTETWRPRLAAGCANNLWEFLRPANTPKTAAPSARTACTRAARAHQPTTDASRQAGFKKQNKKQNKNKQLPGVGFD